MRIKMEKENRLHPHCQTLAVVILAFLAQGCGQADTGATLMLAHGFQPSSPIESRTWRPVTSSRPIRLEPAGLESGYWLISEIPQGAWQPIGAGKFWWAPRPFPGQGYLHGTPNRILKGAEGEYQLATNIHRSLTTSEGKPGLFSTMNDRVLVAPARGRFDPGTLELREYLKYTHFDDVACRVAVGPLIADGIPLLSGDREAVQIDFPEDSVLSFWTTALADDWAADAPSATVQFRVLLDGEELLLHRQTLANGIHTEHHVLGLPSQGRKNAQLTFELTGDPALGAIHVPCIRPGDIGRPGERPWGKPRPDIIVLLLDTFRADNLAAWGGDALVAPHLNSLAERSMVFINTHSNAAWTLPAHASIFSGLLPYQADCVENVDVLADGAVSIAEHLRAVGYRTVAITDAGFVRRDYGMDQGFEWFFEQQRRGEGSFAEALSDARAQLDADDGRPLFLFLHTYRAHEPYEVSDRTRTSLGDELGIRGTWLELLQELGMPSIDGTHPELAAFLARAEPLYRGGVHDLDRSIGEFLGELEARGILPTGRLLVTSDHGEAFGEHGGWGHGFGVHEEQLRIPLLIHGDGIERTVERTPASLIDLAPTIASLAGLSPDRSWIGRDLLELRGEAGTLERMTFAFTGKQPSDSIPESMASIRGDHKALLPSILAPQAGWQAFDLSADPRETQDLSEKPWARSLIQESHAALGIVTTPLLEGGRAQLSAEARRHLAELGYADG